MRVIRNPEGLLAAAVIAGVAALGCGGSSRPAGLEASGSGGSTGGLPSSDGVAGGAPAAGAGGGCAIPPATTGYPPGPYGDNNPAVCSVIEDLQFQGFSNPTAEGPATSQPYAGYSMDDLRTGGATYALVHIAAMWCPSCQAAADDLGARGKEVVDHGGAVLEIVYDGPTPGTPPTQNELAAWVATHDLSVTTVEPADARTVAVFPEREWAYIVDLSSMQVVWKQQGLFSTPTITVTGIDTIIGSYLQ